MHAYSCLTIIPNATGFPVLFASGSAKHCSWHRNFQLSTRVFHNTLQFFISWIDGSVYHANFLRCRASDSFRHICPNLWPQSVCPGSRLFSSQSLPRTMYIHPVVYSSNIVNLVKLVHVSDNSRSPSTFQLYSMLFSNITSKEVSVVLVTSKDFQ